MRNVIGTVRACRDNEVRQNPTLHLHKNHSFLISDLIIRHCDPAISEAVNTIIYAAPRSAEVKELNAVREQLISKYGREFAIAAMENTNDVVNARVGIHFILTTIAYLSTNLTLKY